MLDYLLAFYLVLVLPAQQLWKSVRKSKGIGRTRTQRYWKSIGGIIIPVAIVAVNSWWLGRAPAALGLDCPVSSAGLWGLAIAMALLTGLGVGGPMWEKKLDDNKRAEYLAQMQGNEAMPRTRAELWLFSLMSVVLGTGWEILYRGLLLLILAPVIGTTGAVILSALAYGVAHGYANPRQLAGSIVSAFLFTIGFVLTQSLWWLMLVHVGLPLLGAISCYKALNTSANPAPAAPV